MRGILIVLSLLLTTALTQAHTIITIKNLSDKQPVEVFDCRDRIYLYIVWDSLNIGEHEVETYWFNPQGIQQEFTRYSLKSPVKDTWLWLELHGGGGSEFFRVINPRFGYKDFIGKWTVEIYLDNKHLKTVNFIVQC